ncbi:hypothetical protein [Nesterenkonia sp. AN1]|uniref:hypothetical protein n=1 Tax=Nesterenkonia sp. AN1 TaxID=652017 RepID=UPI0004B966F8|nr:hypothetical protein [Nesterenkonia sp. AN1]
MLTLEALDPMVEALSVVIQLGLTNRNGLVIDGLAVNSAGALEDTSMSVWISSAATIKFI